MTQISGLKGWAVRAALWLALSTLLFIVFFRLTGCVAVVAGNASAWSGERGSGRLTVFSRQTGPFDRILVSGPFEVSLNQGPERKVSVEIDDNLIESLDISTANGLLTIGFKAFHHPSPTVARVRVTTARLAEVSISGSGRVTTPAQLKLEDLELTISGSGRLEMMAQARAVYLSVSGSGRAELGLQVQQASTQISGSGRIRLAGVTDSLDARISGSGRLEATKLKARTCRVTIHGSGLASVRAEEELKATSSGSGKIRYLGRPKVTTRISGSGKVEPLE